MRRERRLTYEFESHAASLEAANGDVKEDTRAL
jgi:hypothetical protein